MTRVGFIGLGVMGSPMAQNLVRAGYEVVGFNRTPEKAQALVSAGGQQAASVADCVRDADVIVTMLPDSPDVEAVAYGNDGVLENARASSLFIDMSTIRPDVAREVFEAGSQKGIRVLDAPVSGGDAGAREGSLSIMVGGREADFADAQPVLQPLGKTIAHVGEAGAGQTVKAANQLIVAVNIEALAEAIVFLQAHGVGLEHALTVLGGGLAGSTVLERKSAGMTEHEFAPGFRLELHRKDLAIVEAAARETDVVIPLGAAVSQLVTSMVAQGEGDLDHSALLRLVEQLSGRGDR